MGMVLDTRPYILYETIGMLVKYVNRRTFTELQTAMQRLYRGCLDATWARRAECLQAIMDEVCGDLNLDDPELQHFFAKRVPGTSRNATTLARVMTIPFMLFQNCDLQEEAEALKETWRRMRQQGVRLKRGMPGISFQPLQEGETMQPIFRQVYSLGYAPDYAMELVNVLEDYDSSMDRLVGLIGPYGKRLEKKLRENAWLMESLGAYWQEQFKTITPETFFNGSTVNRQALAAVECRRVCFALMNAAEAHCQTPEDGWNLHSSIFVLGSMVVAECSQRMYSEDVEGICSTLRTLGDKSRLDLLLRLAEGRGYCQQLAEEAHCNTGNMSRNLAALSACGFLRQEREQSRAYYQTDIERVSTFFQGIVDLLSRRREGRSD